MHTFVLAFALLCAGFFLRLTPNLLWALSFAQEGEERALGCNVQPLFLNLKQRDNASYVFKLGRFL